MVGVYCWKCGSRRDSSPGGANDTKGKLLQIGNNKVSTPVPMFGMHSHSKTSKLNVIYNNPHPGEQ